MRIWAVWVVGAAVGAICGLACAQGALESPELAWLLANESPPALSMRRITPKSVFLAPTFTSCSEGYRQDALGRCVKIVKINQQAQWEFFLQKLQSMYAPPAKDKPPAGPLRLPIPLGEAETETTSVLPLPPLTTDPPTAGTTTVPTSTSATVPTSTTDSVELPTETPLLIIVANTTEPPTTTEREWTSRFTTFTTEPTVRTSTDLPTTMTTMVASTTDCNDCQPTTTPASTGWFSGYDADATTTTPPSTFRPSTYLPPQFRPYDRAPTSRPKIDAQATAVLRPQLQLPLTTPWPPDLPKPTGWPPTAPPTGYSYTTRRSTVRFPSERPPVASYYVRFPVSAAAPQYAAAGPQYSAAGPQYSAASHLPDSAPVWWPPTWEPSQWSPRPSARPWGHREPRREWPRQ